MKICMLVESLPPAYSGAARQALQLAAKLRGRGAEIFFAGAQVVKNSPRDDVVEGFAVHRVPFVISGKWTKLRMLVGYCGIFLRKRREFDVLHIHGPYYLTLAAAMFAKYFLRKKLVLKLTSIAMDTPSAIRRRRWAPLALRMFRRADAIVCMSSAQLADCRAFGIAESQLFKIPNGVDAQKFAPATSESERRALADRLKLPDAAHLALFIGTIEPDKGIELLIETAAHVRAKRNDTAFLLVGPDGRTPNEPHVRREFVGKMRQKIRDLNLENAVHFIGRVENPHEFLRAASIFVSPSRSEGFGTVLVEAMATALPCVALKIPDVTTDIITPDRDGIVIERENPAEFADAILKLLDHPARARELGNAARETARKKFDFDSVAQRHVELYEWLRSRR
jgi:glycosyltransferase involved in cell wall biosynthesis